MVMHLLINSLQNPKIKSVLALQKPRERRQRQLFTIEGRREISLALQAGYPVGNLFFCEEMIDASEVRQLGVAEKNLFPVSRAVFEKLAVREGSGGVLAVAAMQPKTLAQLALPALPLILVLEGVEKPGNLGAMLRTADAAGVDAVICCDTQTDLYNPNVIRASIGCVFTTPVAIAAAADALQWLNRHKISIYATHLAASQPYHLADFRKPSAIVMGSEATGLSDAWLTETTQRIIIPMRGKIDSMNVSTAAAVVVFEAMRQRALP
jgi:TrmH family RNA methyltransferase